VSDEAPRNSYSTAPQLPPDPGYNKYDREEIWQTKRKKRRRRSQRRRNAYVFPLHVSLLSEDYHCSVAIENGVFSSPNLEEDFPWLNDADMYAQYEQLKKQKAKKAGGGKKKEDKTEAPAEAEASTEAPTEATSPDEKPEQVAPEPVEATSVPPPPAEDDDEPSELAVPKPSHGRKPSVAVESRQRSESFYRSGAAGGPLSPGGGVTSEVYREQAQKIEELEKENKRLASEVEENQTRWKKGEEELEELREGRGDVALAVEKGKEADKLVSMHRHIGTWDRTLILS
jgi:hypothetical protein